MTGARSPGRAESIAGVVEVVRADTGLRERARRRLGGREKLLLGSEIVLVYARVRRRVGTPLPALLALLRAGVVDCGAPAAQAPGEHVTAVRLARAVSRLLPRLPGDTRCLMQSLVLTALLSRRGIGSKVLLAVAPGPEFEAHAWVEHGGVPLLRAEDPGFRELAEL